MRTPLTLPPPGFRRLYISYGIAILCFTGLLLSARYTDQNIIPFIFCVLAITISGSICLRQTSSVITQRYFRKPLEYDEHTLYIKQKDGSETAIPFTDISDIPVSFLDQNSWGRSVNFIIKYLIDGRKYEVTLTVSKKTRPQFRQFLQRAQAENPSLQADRWAVGG